MKYIGLALSIVQLALVVWLLCGQMRLARAIDAAIARKRAQLYGIHIDGFDPHNREHQRIIAESVKERGA